MTRDSLVVHRLHSAYISADNVTLLATSTAAPAGAGAAAGFRATSVTAFKSALMAKRSALESEPAVHYINISEFQS